MATNLNWAERVKQAAAARSPKPSGCKSCGLTEEQKSEIDHMKLLRPLNHPRALPDKMTAPCRADVRVFNVHGLNVLYDCNSMRCAAIPPDMASQSKAYSAILGDACSRLRPIAPEPKSMAARALCLNVTHKCNLACPYCFATKGNVDLRDMTVDVAERALKFLDPARDVRVSFFGGEPLVVWPTILQVADKAQDLAQSRRVPCRLHVTTNGTLIDDAKAVELKRRGFSVLVSIDGPKEIHNAARPAKSGDCFDQVMAGLAALNKVGIRPYCRATFTAETPQLIERLNFFAELFDAGKIDGVSVEPAILSEGCMTTEQEPIRDPSALWHEAAAWHVDRIRKGRPILDIMYFRKLLGRLLQGRPAMTECGGGRGYLTVSPDGSIFACHREYGTRIGDLDHGFNLISREVWRDNRINCHAECGSCWARYLCGGGCRQARIAVGGHIHAKTPELCDMRRALLKEVLWLAAVLPPSIAKQVARIRP